MTSNEVGNSITRNTICDKDDLFLITLKELIETEESHDEAVYVYRVPKPLSSAKPEAFTPQFLGLGPYHHSSPNVYYAIEKLKVTKAKNKLNDFSNNIENLKSSNFAHTIRYCYDCSIAFKADTLLYLMTVDALFLHDLLNCSLEGKEEGAVIAVTQLKENISKLIEIRGMPLVNAAGVELTTDAVIRDVFMLENQIPTRILKSIIPEIPSQSTEIHINVDEQMCLARQDFCTILCPFDTNRSIPVNRPAHLLDHMYRLIVPDSNPNPNHEPRTPVDSGSWKSFLLSRDSLLILLVCIFSILNPDHRFKILSFRESLKTLFWGFCSRLTFGLGHELRIFNKCMSLLYVTLAPISVVVCFVFVIRRGLSGEISSLSDLLVNLAKFCYPAVDNLHRDLSNSGLPVLIPLTIWVGQARDALKYIHEQSRKQDITIPSVKELHKAGIHFQPADGGISSIEFVVEECKMYLPSIRLDVNSEVVMRNLVAYESLIKSENLIFTRYTELMRAIINTAEDVELLVDKEIIIIQTDELTPEVVAQLFSGMNKSIKPTKTPALDDVIKKVKDKFDSTQKLYRDIIFSGKIWAAFVALAFLAQTVVKKYCSIFGCEFLNIWQCA